MAIKLRNDFASDSAITKVTTSGTVTVTGGECNVVPNPGGSWNTTGWYDTNGVSVVDGDIAIVSHKSTGSGSYYFYFGINKNQAGLGIGASDMGLLVLGGNYRGYQNGNMTNTVSTTTVPRGTYSDWKFTITTGGIAIDYRTPAGSGSYTNLDSKAINWTGTTIRPFWNSNEYDTDTHSCSYYYITDSSGFDPPAPSTLAANAASTTQIDLTWSDGSNTSTTSDAISIERSLSSGSGYSEIGTAAIGDQAYSDTTCSPATTYYYKIRSNVTAFSTAYYSSYTSVANDTTDSPTISAPSSFAKGTITNSPTHSASIPFSWTINEATYKSGTYIYYSIDGAAYQLLADVNNPATNTYTYATAVQGHHYKFKITTYYSASFVVESGYSNELIFDTDPTPPTALVATAISPTEIDLEWSNSTDGWEDGFSVERSVTSGSGFAEIGTTYAAELTYQDTTCLPGTTYYYRVRSMWSTTHAPTIYSSYTSEATATSISLGSPSQDLLALGEL